MAKIALLIGVSEYEPGLNPLPGTVKDVEAMQQVLVRPDIGEFVESDITVLKNPDRQKMEEEIEKLFASRQKDDLVLLFFSGHGIKDDTGRLYLATRHTRKTPRGELIRSSAVAAGFVHENMERSRCKRQVVILDSCFSGAFAEGLSAKDDGTVNIRDQLGGEGRAVLTSSSSTQYSFGIEQESAELSIYTRYLIDGITTGAADIDEDGLVSIDELHEYASKKVREIQPAMKPEIYAIREGFKIKLTKVPPGDPKEKYGKEVRRYVSRGDVTFVGRKILDAQKFRLGLSVAEATAIEDEILAVARQEFRKKLQQYEQDFTEAVQQAVPVSEADLDLLRQNLKQILGLRNEDTQPIEAQVRAGIEAYKQHLQQYEQVLVATIQQEYPLGDENRDELKRYQGVLELRDEDVARIESRVISQNNAIPSSDEDSGSPDAQTQEAQADIDAVNKSSQVQPEDRLQVTAREGEKLNQKQEKLEPNKQEVKQAIEAKFVSQQKAKAISRRFIELGILTVVLLTFNFLLQPERKEESTSTVSPATSSSARMTSQDFFNRGYDKYGKGDKKGAIADYNQALKLNSVFADAYYNRGLAKYDLGDLIGTIEDSNQALKLNPDYVNAYIIRGLAKYAQGEHKEALADYDQALKLNPYYALAYYNRGLVKYTLGDHNRAIEDYDQALKLDPDYVDAYYNRGLAKYALDDHKGAIEDNNQALKLNPNNADAYNNRGLAKYALGDYKGANADYEQALKIAPDYVDAYYNRGLAKYALGDYKGAIEDNNQAINLNSDYADAYYNRGLARYALGDQKGAAVDYQKSAALYQKLGKTKDYQNALAQVSKLQGKK